MNNLNTHKNTPDYYNKHFQSNQNEENVEENFWAYGPYGRGPYGRGPYWRPGYGPYWRHGPYWGRRMWSRRW